MFDSYETLTLKMDGKPKADGTIEGYGSVFGNVDSYGDTVERGAFEESIRTRKPSMLWQHRMDEPIGGWKEYSEDTTGLWLRGKINLDVPTGRSAYSLMSEGDVDGLSIGFRTIKDEMDGNMRRLTKLELYEVSIVTMPANEAARGRVVKGLWQPVIEKPSDEERTVRWFETKLKEMNCFSRWDRKIIIANGFKAWCDQRDAGALSLDADQRDAEAIKSNLKLLLEGFRK